MRVDLITDAGTIVLALDRRRAPVTTANFLAYVDQHRFDGTIFYRAARTRGAPQRGFIQGGIRHAYARMLPPIAHEPTSQTGLRHVDGTISMARTAPGSATGDFFIIVGPMPSMDAGGARQRRSPRPARLRRLRPGRRGDGRGPPHPRRADSSQCRPRRDARPDDHRAGADRPGDTGGLGAVGMWQA